MALAQNLIPLLAVLRVQLSSTTHWHQTASWRPDSRFTTEAFAQSVRCLWAGGASASHASPHPLSGHKLAAEKRWTEFFSDPSQWWDNRSEKVNPKYPDFKHKKKEQVLWLNNSLNPPWVAAKLAAMTPGILQSNIFSWNVRLRRYVKAGDYKKTLELFKQMRQEGMNANKFTFLPVLNACSSLQALEEGRRVHKQIIETGYDCNVFVTSCLVDMYAKCGSIDDAREVFNKMFNRDVVAWTTMILAYVKCGEGQMALELYRQMQQEGVEPNPTTFVAVLNACATIAALEEGRCVHERILERGYDCDLFVGSSLVAMYAKCGSIEEGWRVFNRMPVRNVVAWSAMLQGYVKCGAGQIALELYGKMQQEGIDPDPMTFVAVLNACANLGALEEGKRVHERIIERGYQCNVFVGSSLVDMYAKCGSIEDARILFNEIPIRDVVTWNAMILGYVKSGAGQKALVSYWQMQQEGVDPNPVTFMAVLNACAIVEAIEEGRRVHRQTIERGYDCDVFVGSSLVDMYAKCASIVDARMVFDKMPTRDVVSWNAMLAGYSRHGYTKEALEHFERMCKEADVDATSFISLLSACNHGGLVDDGIHYFESIRAVFNMSPTMEHYACVIGLLGRGGRLHEAEDLIKIMPYEPAAAVWISLFGACRIHENVDMGEHVAKRVLELEPGNAPCNVLLSNLYAAEESRIAVQE